MIVVMRAMNYPQLAQHIRKDATLKETSVAGPKTLTTSLTGRDKVVERRHGWQALAEIIPQVWQLSCTKRAWSIFFLIDFSFLTTPLVKENSKLYLSLVGVGGGREVQYNQVEKAMKPLWRVPLTGGPCRKHALSCKGLTSIWFFFNLFLRISFRHDKGFLCVHRDIIPKES